MLKLQVFEQQITFFHYYLWYIYIYILGIDNIRSVNQDAKLIELGLDSLMVTEIKQVLEREFDIYLSISEIRQITFRKLKKFSNENSMIIEPDKETESHETISLFPAQSVTLLNNDTTDLTPVLIIVQPLEGMLANIMVH